MMEEESIDSLLEMVRGLSDKEQSSLVGRIMALLAGSRFSERDQCRKCDGDKIVKFGKDKNGKQRYVCKSCGATFTETSCSVISKTRHSEEVWKNYIKLLLVGASLEKCAYQCGISVRTAFIWRHKILNAILGDQLFMKND